MVMTIELLACLWLAPIVELGAAEPSAEKNAENTIKKLYAEQEAAETLSKTAKAIMVFPNVFKAGFIGGAHYGEGVLFRDGQSGKPLQFRCRIVRAPGRCASLRLRVVLHER